MENFITDPELKKIYEVVVQLKDQIDQTSKRRILNPSRFELRKSNNIIDRLFDNYENIPSDFRVGF